MERHRESPMCIHCKHRTIQYAPYIKKRILGCNAKDCKYERREDVFRADKNKCERG